MNYKSRVYEAEGVNYAIGKELESPSYDGDVFFVKDKFTLSMVRWNTMLRKWESWNRFDQCWEDELFPSWGDNMAEAIPYTLTPSLVSNIHELEIESKYYDAIKDAVRPFEILFNDRDYKLGDLIVFKVVDEGIEQDRCFFRIVYILGDLEFEEGLQPGYCILGIKEMSSYLIPPEPISHPGMGI